MVWILLLFALALSSIFILDVQTALFSISIYLVGYVVVLSLNKKPFRKIALDLYNVLFSVGFLYLLLCYIYMTNNNYTSLFSYDAPEFFIPQTQNYLLNGSYANILKSIWGNYIPLSREMPGYFTILTLFGRLSILSGADMYVSLQLSSLLAYTLTGVILYRIFLVNKFTLKESFKYTVLISLFSILFFYSSQILRDVFITLLYLSGVYLIFNKNFSIFTLLKIILIVIVTVFFRIESAMFLALLIPTYLLLSLQRSRQKVYVVMIVGVVGIVLAVFVIRNMDVLSITYEKNRENYVEGISKGSGVIGTLQKIPVFGDFASILYNAVQPIPFWNRFYPPKVVKEDWNVYNVMRFPQAFASFFNLIVIIFLFTWLFSKKIRKRLKGSISTPLQYSLWLGLVFLLLQSAVISQRRLIAFYCIFYVFFFLIYNKILSVEKRHLSFITILIFLLGNTVILLIDNISL